jgi:hypothetical protein
LTLTRISGLADAEEGVGVDVKLARCVRVADVVLTTVVLLTLKAIAVKAFATLALETVGRRVEPALSVHVALATTICKHDGFIKSCLKLL